MQDRVSQFAREAKFGGLDVWIGARRQLQDWTWVKQIPLSKG